MMHKVIYELGSINKTMKLKFNLVIRNEEPIKQATYHQDIRAISSFMMGSTEYLKLQPYPYLSIDISKSSDRGDAWNQNLVVNLGSMSIFILQKKLKQILNGFQVKDLFLKQAGRLFVNQQVSNELNQYVRLPNKVLKLAYTVVPDEENKEVEYEGIAFMINSPDNYCYLTYEEIEYLLYTLNKIDLNVLSVQVINSYLLDLLHKQFSHTKPEKIYNGISEKKEDPPETPHYAKIEEPSEIPKI